MTSRPLPALPLWRLLAAAILAVSAGRVLPALGLIALGLVALGGCEDPAKNAPRAPTTPGTAVSGDRDPAPAAAGPVLKASPDDEALHRPAPERIVAIGDLHGDLVRTLRALKLAGAIDDKGKWIGGKMTLVQTGDQVDRGDDDRAILDLFDRLKAEAKEAGGEVVATLGNHELMNVQLDFRYVTDGSLAPFDDFAQKASPALAGKVPVAQRGRAAAFAPGGTYAKRLAERPIAAWVGNSLFVHGGILPKHVREGLAKTDREVRAWLLGDQPSPPRSAMGEDGMMWTRLYGAAPGRVECGILDEVLGAYGAKRLVIGHTVQRGGIKAACDGKVWRIDVGLSRHYGGPLEVLQIRGDETVILKDDE